MKTIVQMTREIDYAPNDDDNDDGSSVVSDQDYFGEDAPMPNRKKTVYKLDKTYSKGPTRKRTIYMDAIVDKKFKEVSYQCFAHVCLMKSTLNQISKCSHLSLINNLKVDLIFISIFFF